MARRDDAHGLADEVAHLLRSMIPAEVWRAEWQLATGHAVADAQHQLGKLLTFHQDVGSPISEMFSYSLPCASALQRIARYAGARGVIEVGAGNGLWAAFLQAAGIQTSAWDSGRAETVFPFTDEVQCGSVEGGDEELLRLLAAREVTLLLVWPPLELESSPDGRINRMARNVLEVFGGEYIVYIGEWRDSVGIVAQLSDRTHEHGQTAGALFQAAVEASFELVERIRTPRWPGFADDLRVYRRRRTRAACDEDESPALVQRHDDALIMRQRQNAGSGVGELGHHPRRRLQRCCLQTRLSALRAAGLLHSRPGAVLAAVALERFFSRSENQ